MLVYKITNRITGQNYIGSTKRSLYERLSNHRSFAARGLTYPLASAIREYGWDAFEVTELGRAESAKQLAEMEKAAIVLYNSLVPHGYNLSPGGPGSGPMSEATREKQRLAHLGRTPWITGKQHTPEVKAKMSATRKGHGWNQRAVEFNGVAYPSAALAARAHSLSLTQMRRRLALGLARYLEPSKLPAGFGGWNKGKTASAEARRKMSEARKGRTFWKMRAIAYQGVTYPSVDAAMTATGLSRQNFKTLVKRGEAQYLTAPGRFTCNTSEENTT